MNLEVATFTFKGKDWETARSDLLPYATPVGTLDLAYGGSVRKSKIVEISTILEVAISGVKRISCIAKRIWPLLGRIWPDHGVRSVAFAEVRR